MSLTKLMKDDDVKYIAVNDFIELMVNHTNDSPDVVIEYLAKYSSAKGSDVKIYIKGFVNEYSPEWTLSELLVNTFKELRPYTLSELKAEEDFVRYYILKKDIFNAKYIKALNLNYDSKSWLHVGTAQQRLISQAPKPPSHIQPTLGFKKRTVGEVIEAEKRKEAILPNIYKQQDIDNTVFKGIVEPVKHRQDNTVFTELGEHQKQLITYDVFTPEQVICLIIDYDSNHIVYDRKFLSYWTTIGNAIDAGELIPFNEGHQIEADQVKIWLAQNNYIYQGFNDHIQTDPIAQIRRLRELLEVANAKIKEMELEASYQAESPTPISNDHLYDWQKMDKNQYPPELHLAIEIWKEYYQTDVIEHITQFDSGRFNRIATNLKLKDGNLKKRIRTLLTPVGAKTKSPDLIKPLQAIDILYTDKLDQD